MWIIELNLDDDFSKTSSYHIDEESNTIHNHIYCALENRKQDRWVYIGAAHTLAEAREKRKKIQLILCEMSGRTATSINWSD